MFGMENEEKQFGSRDRKPWGDRRNDNFRRENRGGRPNSFGRRNFDREDGNFDRPRFSRPFRKDENNGEQSERRFDRPRRFDGGDREQRFRRFDSDNSERRPYRKFNDENSERRPFKPRRFDNDERPRRFDGEGRRFDSDGFRPERRRFENDENRRWDRDSKPRRFRSFDNDRKPFRKNNYERPIEYTNIDKNLLTRNFDDAEDSDEEMVILSDIPTQEPESFEPKRPATESEGYRLNRFISTAGVCSRRAADDYIAEGRITVNGAVVTDFSTKVMPGDEVCLDGKKLTSQKRVYIAFNKPKDCISTKSDELGRRTIYDYVKTDVEVKNVGRLDRDTTGIMLLTNDGDLIDRLTHPRYNKMKIYHVFLNKNVSVADMEAIKEGVDLEPQVAEDGTEIKGGHIDVDDIQYVDNQKNQVGIQIHSGLYHVVRRIFEKYGYQVEKLDRVYFAGLTKKGLPRGRWRYLTSQEIAILKRGAYA